MLLSRAEIRAFSLNNLAIYQLVFVDGKGIDFFFLNNLNIDLIVFCIDKNYTLKTARVTFSLAQKKKAGSEGR